MILENLSKRTYQHSFFDDNGRLQFVNLKPHTRADIPEEVAKQWLKSAEVREYVAPEDAKAKEKALIAEIEQLKAENEKLKAKKKNGKH